MVVPDFTLSEEPVAKFVDVVIEGESSNGERICAIGGSLTGPDAEPSATDGTTVLTDGPCVGRCLPWINGM